MKFNIQWDFNPGDFIKIKDPVDARKYGIVLGWDLYTSSDPAPGTSTPIIEILWSTGTIGWIARNRIMAMDNP